MTTAYGTREPEEPPSYSATASVDSTDSQLVCYGDIFHELSAAGIVWCLLRLPSNTLPGSGDVDLLVHHNDLTHAQRVLESIAFTVRAPWDGGSDHHLDRYCRGQWERVHIVTELSFGRFHTVRTEAAAGVLARAKRDRSMIVPAPDDAVWLTLLHCLVDKGRISEAYRVRLPRLVEVGEPHGQLARCIDDLCAPGWDTDRILEAMRAGDWDDLETAFFRASRRWFRRHPISSSRALVGEVLRKTVTRLLVPLRRRGVSIALLGPDGAGKTTLAHGLRSTFVMPVHIIHMGLSDDQVPGFARLRIPRVGAPGRVLVTAARYFRGQYFALHGHVTVFDRYTYDLLLPSAEGVSATKLRMKRLLARMFPPPNLVLLLDLPGAAAFARKHEYDPGHMERHRRHLLELSLHLPHAQVIDAARPPETVRNDATAYIWQELSRRWRDEKTREISSRRLP